jgi:hypothetical protein
MLTGESYEEVLVATAQVAPTVLQAGLTWVQMKKIAKLLGFRATVKRKRAIDIEGDTGILCVNSPKWKADHVVVLREGLIIDTDGSLWEPSTFLSANSSKVQSLLVLEPIAANEPLLL